MACALLLILMAQTKCGSNLRLPRATSTKLWRADSGGFCTSSVKGEFTPSREIVQQWKSKKGRQSLEKLFQTVGFNMDWLGSAEAYALYNYSKMVGNWAGYPYFSAWHSLKEEFGLMC